MTTENKRDYKQDWLEFINHQHMIFTGFEGIIQDTVKRAIESDRYYLEEAINEIKDKKLRDDIMQKHLDLDQSIEALDNLSILNFYMNPWINEEKLKDEKLRPFKKKCEF